MTVVMKTLSITRELQRAFKTKKRRPTTRRHVAMGSADMSGHVTSRFGSPPAAEDCGRSAYFMSTSDDDEEHGVLLVKKQAPSWARWARDGNLDTIVPLVVLAVLSVGVLVYNMFFREWEACDENKPLAKHFYCYNASRPPGFHLDTPAG